MEKLKLRNFEFEIDYEDKLSITEFGFATISIPLRQAKVLSKWLQEELKTKTKK